MAGFLFQIEMVDVTDKVEERIPAHREHINRLFSQGRLLSYSVSVSRNMIWCVVNAEEEAEAMEIVLQFPLYEFFTDVTCHPLLFHNVLPATLPGISLN